jgi:hypothetical protein
MTDAELLEKVKIGLQLTGTAHDLQLQIKTTAVKEYMLNAGIIQEQIETSLGIACLTVGVMDLWNIESGEVKFSKAFVECLMPQLQAISM